MSDDYPWAGGFATFAGNRPHRGTYGEGSTIAMGLSATLSAANGSRATLVAPLPARKGSTMLKRLIRWLLGIPPKDQLEAHRRLAAERDGSRTGAIEANDRSMTGGGYPPGFP